MIYANKPTDMNANNVTRENDDRNISRAPQWSKLTTYQESMKN